MGKRCQDDVVADHQEWVTATHVSDADAEFLLAVTRHRAEGPATLAALHILMQQGVCVTLCDTVSGEAHFPATTNCGMSGRTLRLAVLDLIKLGVLQHLIVHGAKRPLYVMYISTATTIRAYDKIYKDRAGWYAEVRPEETSNLVTNSDVTKACSHFKVVLPYLE